MNADNNKNFLIAIDNFCEGLLRVLGKKYDMSNADKANIRKDLTETINNCINETTELSLRSIDIVLSNYSEKRGVGEHG